MKRERECQQREVGHCVPFLSQLHAKCQLDERGQTLAKFLPRWSSGTDMAPSTQLKEAMADVQEGIRAILLGPPGAGKGTQVRASRAKWLAVSIETPQSMVAWWFWQLSLTRLPATNPHLVASTCLVRREATGCLYLFVFMTFIQLFIHLLTRY